MGREAPPLPPRVARLVVLAARLWQRPVKIGMEVADRAMEGVAGDPAGVSTSEQVAALALGSAVHQSAEVSLVFSWWEFHLNDCSRFGSELNGRE